MTNTTHVERTSYAQCNSTSSLSIHKLIRFPVVLITLSVLAIGFPCAGMLNHGSMHESMSVAAIMPDNGQQECCNTSISKHIESWKSALLVLPREIKDGLLLFRLGLIVVAFVGLWFRYSPDDSHQLSYGLYRRDNPEFTLFNQLKLAFARGILNPKIY